LADEAYVTIAGAVNVTTVDEDNQDVILDQPAAASSSAWRRCSTRRLTRPMQPPSKTPRV
jgi:hypothetical protein